MKMLTCQAQHLQAPTPHAVIIAARSKGCTSLETPQKVHAAFVQVTEPG